MKNLKNYPRNPKIPALIAILAILPTLIVSFSSTVSSLTSSSTANVRVAAENWIVPSVNTVASDYRTVNVTWPKLANYSNYKLEWANNSSFTNASTATVSGTSYTVNNLTALTNYYFRVQPVGGPVASWSPLANIKTSEVTILKSTLLNLRKWPSASDMDSKGNVWLTGYVDYTVRIISPDGTVRNVGVYDDGVPAGMTVVNDDTALITRTYREAERASEAGIYSITSSGEYKQVLAQKSVYGLAYDAKRNKVYVTNGTNILECNYQTWACSVMLTQTGSSFGYLAMTPSNDKLVIAGRNTNTLSLYDLNTRKQTVIDGTPNMDIRGVAAISETEFAAGSASTYQVWKIKTNSTGTEMASKEVVATDIAYPLNMSYDPTRKMFYMGGTDADGPGLYRFENMFGN